MAKLDYLLQAATFQNHSTALSKMLTNGFDSALFGVAFARAQGVQTILEMIPPGNCDRIKIFIGIRNGITSYQAVELLVRSGASVFAVDTGATTTLFHPKVFVTQKKSTAQIIIGSANLTFNGLHNNIEAGCLLELDLSDENDNKFLNKISSSFFEMAENFPRHVKKIQSFEEIEMMRRSDLLVDEAVDFKNLSKSATNNLEEQILMPLYRQTPISTIKRKTKTGRIDQLPKIGDRIPFGPTLEPHTLSRDEFYLVWQSEELKERDLNIPTGINTNPTGSMYWKKGAYDNIDHRHYFRDEVFSDLAWQIDLKIPHYERVYAYFHFVINGKYYGGFDLKLSHSNNVESITYKQNNSMTQVSWGVVKGLIAKRSLLGRIMYLYRKETSPPQFLIQID